MKGKISLSAFIDGVKNELIDSAKKGSEKPFFVLEDVELEAEFGVEVEGKTGFKFFVDLEGKASGTQTHRVKLRLKPLPPPVNPLDEKEVNWIKNSEGESAIVLQNSPGELPSDADPFSGKV